MVDIHCHIIPEVDDGSRSWEMTREMCRIAADDGVRHIVATPHCNDEYPYDRERYEGLRDKLREASEWKSTVPSRFRTAKPKFGASTGFTSDIGPITSAWTVSGDRSFM